MGLLAVFTPLIGFLVAGLFGKQIGDKGAQFVTCAGMVLAALASIGLFGTVIMQDMNHVIPLMTWISSGDFHAEWALRIDTLSVVMMCVPGWRCSGTASVTSQ